MIGTKWRVGDPLLLDQSAARPRCPTCRGRRSAGRSSAARARSRPAARRDRPGPVQRWTSRVAVGLAAGRRRRRMAGLKTPFGRPGGARGVEHGEAARGVFDVRAVERRQRGLVVGSKPSIAPPIATFSVRFGHCGGGDLGRRGDAHVGEAAALASQSLHDVGDLLAGQVPVHRACSACRPAGRRTARRRTRRGCEQASATRVARLQARLAQQPRDPVGVGIELAERAVLAGVVVDRHAVRLAACAHTAGCMPTAAAAFTSASSPATASSASSTSLIPVRSLPPPCPGALSSRGPPGALAAFIVTDDYRRHCEAQASEPASCVASSRNG